MNDKQISALFMSQILPAMQANADLSGVKLKRNFQSRIHGADTGPYVYFVKITDHLYGHKHRSDEWDSGNENFTHTEAQLYESTWQFSAWVPQTPADTTSLTESDILNIVSGIIQSDSIIAAFIAAGVGIRRVEDVRNPYITDDRDQFAATPSFDIVLVHEKSLVSTIPAVVTYEANLGRV